VTLWATHSKKEKFETKEKYKFFTSYAIYFKIVDDFILLDFILIFLDMCTFKSDQGS
jgi:hypothetical protein